MSLNNQEIKFDDWIKTVNTIVDLKSGFSLDDLPDEDYRSFFDSGITTTEMVYYILNQLENYINNILD